MVSMNPTLLTCMVKAAASRAVGAAVGMPGCGCKGRDIVVSMGLLVGKFVSLGVELGICVGSLVPPPPVSVGTELGVMVVSMGVRLGVVVGDTVGLTLGVCVASSWM